MKKINFKDINNELSRSEMKQIMAGTEGQEGECGYKNQCSPEGCTVIFYSECSWGWSKYDCGDYTYGPGFGNDPCV